MLGEDRTRFAQSMGEWPGSSMTFFRGLGMVEAVAGDGLRVVGRPRAKDAAEGGGIRLDAEDDVAGRVFRLGTGPEAGTRRLEDGVILVEDGEDEAGGGRGGGGIKPFIPCEEWPDA